MTGRPQAPLSSCPTACRSRAPSAYEMGEAEAHASAGLAKREPRLGPEPKGKSPCDGAGAGRGGRWGAVS